MKKRYILLSIFAAFSIFFYWVSAPDNGGKQALLREIGIDMNAVSCEPIPYYIYTPLPFSLTDSDKRRFKFRLSESEFEKFKNKYHHLLNFRDSYEGGGPKEYLNEDTRVPFLTATYEYSSSCLIIIFYAPSLSEIIFVLFYH